MTQIEYHQFCITKIPITVEWCRAEIAMLDATTAFFCEYPSFNLTEHLDMRKLVDKRITGMGEDFLNHSKELEQMEIDPLDHFPFTEEDKACLSIYYRNSKEKRIVIWIYRLFGK